MIIITTIIIGIIFILSSIVVSAILYLNDEYVALNDEPIDTDYISRLKDYANQILDVSNGIVLHDLIKNEEDKIGACEREEKK